MSTSTSCTATTRTCRSASSSTRSTPRSAAGRIRGPFGGSNWTRERFDAAVAYAEANGKARADGALQQLLARRDGRADLARLHRGVRHGLEGVARRARGDELRLVEPGPRLLRGREGQARQRRGGHAVWHSKANLARRERARTLAARLGRPPIHVALAYVLAQPFPVVPLIGPRRLVELDDSVAALAIALGPEQVRWLESGESGPAEAGSGRPRVRRSAARRR